MRFVRCIEDDRGDLSELVYYCGVICYEAEGDRSILECPGGAWPCLEGSLDREEECRSCGGTLNSRLSCEAQRPGPAESSVAHVNFCEVRGGGR